MSQQAIPFTIEVLEKLRWNSHLNKHCHFAASRKGRSYHIAVGIPIVIINLVLGSVFFTLVGAELPQWSKWAGAGLALLAALLGGIQTFFNFQKDYEGHREIGNEYLAIARECERIIAQYFDQMLTLEQVAARVDDLNKAYAEVNQRAEDYIVSDKHYKKALAIQTAKADRQPSLVTKMQQQA